MAKQKKPAHAKAKARRRKKTAKKAKIFRKKIGVKFKRKSGWNFLKKESNKTKQF